MCGSLPPWPFFFIPGPFLAADVCCLRTQRSHSAPDRTSPASPPRAHAVRARVVEGGHSRERPMGAPRGHNRSAEEVSGHCEPPPRKENNSQRAPTRTIITLDEHTSLSGGQDSWRSGRPKGEGGRYCRWSLQSLRSLSCLPVPFRNPRRARLAPRAGPASDVASAVRSCPPARPSSGPEGWAAPAAIRVPRMQSGR